MASLREIKKKIKSAKNIGQVTKALEMVSSVKMRKSQAEAIKSQPYAQEISAALESLSVFTQEDTHPLLAVSKNTSAPIQVVIIAPDKGLAGPLITNMLRETLHFKAAQKNPIQAIVWGKKAGNIAIKSGIDVVADVTPTSNQPANVQIALLARLVVSAFTQGDASEIYLIYTSFKSALTQTAKTIKFLPILRAQPEANPQSSTTQLVSFEPTPSEVQDFVLHQYIEVKLNQIFKESVAAEHSARMVAMKKATDNARDIVTDYQLIYNKTRQEKITSEIADLTANMTT